MPILIVRCETCGEVLGELEDGVLVSRHHKRRFVDPMVLQCRCGHLWFNPDLPIDDERIRRYAKVLTSSPAAVVAAG